MLSIVEIVNCVQKIGTGALLIVTNYVLGLIWGIDSILHSKDENGNLLSSSTAVLLKFDTLHLFGKLYTVRIVNKTTFLTVCSCHVTYAFRVNLHSIVA